MTSELNSLLTFTFVSCLVQDCLCWLNLAIPGQKTTHRVSFTKTVKWDYISRKEPFLKETKPGLNAGESQWFQIHTLYIYSAFTCFFSFSGFVLTLTLSWTMTKAAIWEHTPNRLNAQLTSPFRLCCYEKRFHFCFVLANTIGNMNKTQANRTQTAAAAAYMGECLSPYACDSEGKRGDKTPLIMVSTAYRSDPSPKYQVSNMFTWLVCMTVIFLLFREESLLPAC